MPRTVDEILRDAGVAVEELVAEAELGADEDGISFAASAFVVAFHYAADDPTERAALVSHMVEHRDRQPAGKA